jgi:hypothetical protein
VNQQLDPVNAMVALLTLLLGPAVAKIIGPYAIILIAASTGAAWSLGRRPTSSRLNAFWFFARLNLTAMLLTVSLAMMVRHWGLPIDPQWLLAPIAILIGGVGDDWPAVGKFVIERMGRLVDRKIDNVGPARNQDGTNDYRRQDDEPRNFGNRNGD